MGGRSVEDPEEIIFGGKTYSRTRLMLPHDISHHVKTVTFRIPLLRSCPSFSHQIIGKDRFASPMTVTSLKVAEVGSETEIVIAAETLDAAAPNGVHLCNLVIVDHPGLDGAPRIQAGANQWNHDEGRNKFPVAYPAGVVPVVVATVKNTKTGIPMPLAVYGITNTEFRVAVGRSNDTYDRNNGDGYQWVAVGP